MSNQRVSAVKTEVEFQCMYRVSSSSSATVAKLIQHIQARGYKHSKGSEYTESPEELVYVQTAQESAPVLHFFSG